MPIEQALWEWVLTLCWALVGALSMALALAILLKVFSKLTPIEEWEEIRKGNMAVAVVLGAAIIAFALVVGSAIRLI
jgi:uncharacterized membrane protein YjfL (UPF0719 family)